MLPDRILPNDLHAEMALLGSIFLDPEIFGGMRSIATESDFYRQRHASVWRIMETLYNEGIEIDIITVRTSLEIVEKDLRAGDIGPPSEFISAIMESVPTSVNAENYANVISRMAKHRKVIAYADELSEMAYSDKPPEEIGRSLLDQGVEISRASPKAAQLVPIREVMDQHFNALQDVFEGGMESWGLRSRISDLDSRLGGLQKGKLYIAGAQTSMGKTQFAVQIALNVAWVGNRVAYFSLEEAPEDLIARQISITMDLDWKRLQTSMDRDMYRDAFNDGIGKVGDLPIWTTDMPRMSSGEINAQALVMKARSKALDLIVVDFLQLIDDRTGPQDSRVEIVDRISQSLKAMARELNVPVIACAQLRRPSGDRTWKEPTLWDLRESGGIEQNADAVLLLWRPGYFIDREIVKAEQIAPRGWENRSGEELGKLLRVIIAKNRGGPIGIADLRFDVRSGRITGWSDSERN